MAIDLLQGRFGPRTKQLNVRTAFESATKWKSAYAEQSKGVMRWFIRDRIAISIKQGGMRRRSLDELRTNQLSSPSTAAARAQVDSAEAAAQKVG
jgi:hypothetical protein